MSTKKGYVKEWVAVQARLGLVADGLAGEKTLAACHAAMKLECGCSWALVQMHLGVAADGVPGAKTAAAMGERLGILTVGPAVQALGVPTQAAVRAGSSIYGLRGSNLVSIALPYPMRLSWELGTVVSKLTCHKLVAERLTRIFERTLAYYGLARIKELGLDILGGCYNDRRVTNGTLWSTHAWGIAIDIDPDHNQLAWGAAKARLARPEYKFFVGLMYEYGAVNQGVEKNNDWMHFQFASYA